MVLGLPAWSPQSRTGQLYGHSGAAVLRSRLQAPLSCSARMHTWTGLHGLKRSEAPAHLILGCRPANAHTAGSADCGLIYLVKEKPMSWIAKMIAVGLLATSTAFAAELQTAILDVKNMQCQMCSITVKKALQKVPGVEDAKIDLDRKNATVKFDPDKTNPDALATATTKAGFPSTVHKE